MKFPFYKQTKQTALVHDNFMIHHPPPLYKHYGHDDATQTQDRSCAVFHLVPRIMA